MECVDVKSGWLTGFCPAVHAMRNRVIDVHWLCFCLGMLEILLLANLVLEQVCFEKINWLEASHCYQKPEDERTFGMSSLSAHILLTGHHFCNLEHTSLSFIPQFGNRFKKDKVEKIFINKFSGFLFLWIFSVLPTIKL